MLNFCCKLAVLYHGTAMVIAPLLKRAFGRNLNMRRKVKQLLATGMTLAVLSGSALAVFALSATKECGTLYWSSGLKTCRQTATLVSTEKNALAHTGVYRCPDGHETKVPEAHSYEVVWEEGSATKDGVGTMYLSLKCRECGYQSQSGVPVTCDTPTGHTEATCEDGATYTYAANSFSLLGYTYDKEVTLTVPDDPAKGHLMGEYAYNNDATCTKDGTMTRRCMNVNSGKWCEKSETVKDPNHPATGHGWETYIYNNDATCTKDGTMTATCWHVNDGKQCGETDTKKDPDHKATGHLYDVSGWSWSDDYKQATVTLKCQNAGCNDTMTETVQATCADHKDATCTQGVENVYVATFTPTDTAQAHYVKASYTDEKTEVIPATGHSYNNYDFHWDDETTYKSATLTWYCGNDGCDYSTQESLNATETVTKPATCTDTGRLLHEVSFEFGGEKECLKETTIIPALGHACSLELKWDDDTCTSATATVKCSDCDYERDVPVTITAVRTEPTCTEIGYIDYTATADVTYDPKTEGRSPEKESAQIDGQTILPALGHSFTNYVYNGDATCGGDGTETAKCDRCDVTDTRTAVATAGCDLHTVDGAKVCAVCGKVDGQPKLAAAEANADVNASTIGVHLVVRVGTLPTGQKVITVAFLNNDGQAVQMFGTQKIHVSLAQLKAALGDTEGTGFEHTLTRVNTANGEKQNVGFTVENGTVNFDAAFNGSTACILLVD